MVDPWQCRATVCAPTSLARAYGIASALVPGFGFFSGEDVDNTIARTGVAADYMVQRP